MICDLPTSVRRLATCTTRRRRTRAQQHRHGAAIEPPARAFRGRCASKRLNTLANGERRPISEIREGDMVLATDPETGETGAREVIATLPHTDQLLTLRLSSGDVVTTEDHRYWNDTDQAWQESQDLDEGDRLLTADGDIVTVEGLDWSSVHTDDAYDLDVADLDSFYVGAGDESVLVHNQEPPCLSAIKIAQHADKAGHVIPGVDDLAQYVDDVMQAPGAAATRGRTVWWDTDKGAIVIREADGNGSVFVPDRGYQYYLDQLAE